MKRYLKSLFKISISLITIGTIVMFIGLLMGGAKALSKEVTELVHVVRVGVAETVERIPLLESITNINGFTLVVDRDEVKVEVNEEYETINGDYSNLKLAEASQVQNLDISILNGKCYILPSANGYYGIESSDAEDFQCYVSDGTLYLSAFPKDFGTDAEKAEIILYIPNEAEYEKVILFCSGEQLEGEVRMTGNELSISSICGKNTFSDNLIFEDAVITVGIGELNMNGLSADSVKIEVSTAEAEIDNLQADTMEVSLGMGTLSIQGITEKDIILNCGMGHLDIMLGCAQEDYNYDISGSAESVQIGTDTLAGMVMERWIDNGSHKKITMSCAMGSVKIEFEQ